MAFARTGLNLLHAVVLAALMILPGAARSADPASAAPKFVQSASMKPEEAMNFVVAEDPDCSGRPDCVRWLAAEGAIGPDTPQKLKAALDGLGGKKLAVFLNSRGGDYDAAMQMGELLHDHLLPVSVGATTCPQCQPGPGLCRFRQDRPGPASGLLQAVKGNCDLACVFVLAGGVQRSIPQDLVMEMPVIYGPEQKDIPGWVLAETDAASNLQSRILQYLQRHQVGNPVHFEYLINPASQRRWIHADDALRTRLVDDVQEAERVLLEGRHAEEQAAEAGAASPAPDARAEPLIISASSGTEPRMEFLLLERSDCAGKGGCAQFISAEGAIEPDTPARFRTFLDSNHLHGLAVILQSRGGDYQAGMELGRIARAHALQTAVAETGYLPCRGADCRAKSIRAGHAAGQIVDDSQHCDMACVLFLAGGTERLVPAAARLATPRILVSAPAVEAARKTGAVLATSTTKGALRQPPSRRICSLSSCRSPARIASRPAGAGLPPTGPSPGIRRGGSEKC
nr:hypothetical protein [uncultured Gellertiella sp.]